MTHIEQQRIIALIEKDDLDAALEQIGAMEEALVAKAGERPDPTHVVDLLTLRATVHMRSDDHERALSVINDMVEVQPGNPVTLLMMGATLAQLDRTDEARRVFDVVERLADDPWATEARNALITLAEADAANAGASDDATAVDSVTEGAATAAAASGIVATGNNDSNTAPMTRLSIVCAEGLDSFVLPLRALLEERYEVRVYTVASKRDLTEALEWADVCWFESCDATLARASTSMAKSCKVICRIHGHEVFTDVPASVNWGFVDHIVFVAAHVREIFEARVPDCMSARSTVANGVQVDKLAYAERTSGFNLAYAGFLGYSKNPAMLLQIIAKLVAIDERYRLHIAGAFQDISSRIYFDHMVRTLGLTGKVIYSGWADDVDAWLDDKNYVLSTSIFESFGMSIAEGMAKGIKPIVHNWPGATGIYPDAMLFATIDEAVAMITDGTYRSSDYRAFIEDHYDIRKQIVAIEGTVQSVLARQLERVAA